MKRLAHGHLRGERCDHTLNTTGLVHEACLRLVDTGPIWPSTRPHDPPNFHSYPTRGGPTLRSTTKSVEVDEDLLTTLADIYQVDSFGEALEIALWRVQNIIEIEILNRSTGDRYWPGFDPGEYLKMGDSKQDPSDDK